jgi:curved DNA-binding protein CbpA
MAKDDYYSILGVDRQAPDREIKRAYYALARDLHPDKAKDPEEARLNAERLATISKAYNTLKDPKKRAEYDAANKGASSAPAAAPRPAVVPPAAAPAPVAPAAGAPPPGAPRPDPQANAVKVSSNDLTQQRVLTAQKAFVKGMEYWKANDLKKALPFFEAAVSNDPDNEPHYHMKLALCLMRTKGSFSRAVAAAEKACSMDAYNMEFKLGLAEIYETVGVTSKAKDVYEDILRWEPDNERAKNRLKLLNTAAAQANPSLLAKVFPSLFGKK